MNRRKLELVRAAEEGAFDADREHDIQYLMAGLLRTSIGPYRNPDRPGRPPLRVWERRDGACQVLVEPGLEMRNGVPTSIGLAYGSYPRLLNLHVCDRAVKTGNRKIELGPSLASWLRTLNIGATGGANGTITRIRDQAKRLFRSRISIQWDDPTGQRDIGGQMIIASAWNLCFPGSIAEMEAAALWPAEIELSEEFFKQVMQHPVPLNGDAVRALQRSAPALDLYAFLTYRNATLSKPVTIPWRTLPFQFGYQFADTPQGWSQFKRDFSGHLHQVRLVYPQARAETTDAGLLMRPSLTSVPFRGVRALRAAETAPEQPSE